MYQYILPLIPLRYSPIYRELLLIHRIVIYIYILYSYSMVNTLNWYINIRDIIREYFKECNTINHDIYIYYSIVFMYSETLLFMVLLWYIFHIILSYYYIYIDTILILEPYELAHGTTLLLSSASISMGHVYIIRV